MEDWIKHQRALLELELAEEATLLSDRIASLSAKACENEGLSMVNLETVATRTELFGRCCVEFQKIGKVALPTCFKVGDEVTIISANTRGTISSSSSNKEADNEHESEMFGLIKSTSQFSIEVVIDEYDDRLIDFPLRLNLRPSMKTHTKMMEALAKIAQSAHPLLSMLYRPKESIFEQRMLINGNIKISQWYNNRLNESQKNAIETCLNATNVSIVHGPPGTGKTSTLTELLTQALERRQKLLVCAPSNIAVDTILLRLVDCLSSNKGEGKSKSQVTLANFRNQIIRIGHPARVSSGILEFTLDSHIEHDEGTDIVNDIRKEMQDLRGKLQNPRGFKSKDGSTQMNRREIRSELKAIKKEAINREKAIVERLVRNANVVFATCVGASSYLLKDLQFDLVVVDEAAQALEAACWIPIMKGAKCVLAGDHCQLPPTIKSKAAEEGGLHETLFEKIIKDPRFSSIVKLLNVQYRMNDVISRWASKNMYNNNVQSAPTVAHHTILDLFPKQVHETNIVLDNDDPENAIMLMIDTSDCYMFEDISSDGTSHRNANEAEIVLQHVAYLLQSGISPSDIGVITPYNGQLELLRDMFDTTAAADPSAINIKGINVNVLSQLSGVDIKTIDGFQGGEKECIIISLVRSNEQHTVGFLGENRRINVAVTRAKRQVTIVCDSSTCSTNAFIKTLINHIEENGEVIPAEVYMDQHSHIQSKSSATPNAANVTGAKSTAVKKESSKVNKKGPTNKESSSSKSNNKLGDIGGSKKLDSSSSQKLESTAVSDELCKKIDELLSNYCVGRVDNGVVDADLINVMKDASSDVLLFPAKLSSFHRLYVHQSAEEKGLLHVSTGEGSDRRISVSRKGLSDKKESSKHVPVPDPVKEVVPQKIAQIVDSDGEDDSTDPIMLGEQSATQATAITNSLSSANNSNTSAIIAPAVNTSAKTTKDSKGKGKAKAEKDPINNKDIDEDELLNALVQQNMRLAEMHKYRMGSRPMPNYDKECTKQKLKSKLAEAQAARRPTSSNSEKDTSSTSTSSSSRSKVVKKPVPNFGGGKVGTK